MGRIQVPLRYSAVTILLWALTTSSLDSLAAEGALEAIPLGISHIDFNGDRRPEIVVRAWRENFNAHGFFVLSFYSEDPARQALVAGRSVSAPLGSIPVKRLNGEEFATTLWTEQGADCVLTDFRLLRSGQRIMLVQAERGEGRGYDDRRAVVFTVYELRQNDAELPGLPDSYFSPVGHYQTKRRYCDVTDAFDAEAARLLSEFREWRG